MGRCLQGKLSEPQQHSCPRGSTCAAWLSYFVLFEVPGHHAYISRAPVHCGDVDDWPVMVCKCASCGRLVIRSQEFESQAGLSRSLRDNPILLSHKGRQLRRGEDDAKKVFETDIQGGDTLIVLNSPNSFLKWADQRHVCTTMVAFVCMCTAYVPRCIFY